jgi:hypothetical protein
VAPARFRPLVVIAAGALLLAALVVSGAAGSSPQRTSSSFAYTPSIDAAPSVALRPARLAREAASFRGGPTTASTGETVDVRVSDSLPAEVTPESWAELFVGLDHGSELGDLTAYVTTLDEVQQVCGDRALGCYAQDQLVVPGATTPDGTTPEEIVRHEYGHHIAFHRKNDPWAAIDWGPKNWASAEMVCSKVSRKEAFPGDEGSNYSLNPGEAWAETYRLLEERKAGITTASWQIVAPSFYPGEAALQAAARDVLRPWTVGKTTLFTRIFGKATKKVWWIPLATPLDGDLRINATVPNGANPEVALVGANRGTVIGRAQWVGQRVKSLTGSVCGQRSLFVRVTERGALGRVRVSAATP